ncbi:MAG TPA: protein-glutamate O-methyltransferase CheR [Firmicutes bacterium]|nr:protein-glutamate O-methyltransferase CheR [Candidatus Fermentithermobacillaceae bacterium]
MAKELIDPKDDIRAYGADYVHFCLRLKKLSGIDLSSYKSRQMHRRLQNYRNRLGFSDFYTFSVALQKDEQKLKGLLDFITINVSEFFRNPEQWRILRESVLPTLVVYRSGQPVRVWSAGSSAGQEAYSLAISVLEAGGVPKVLGTDIDEASLKKARAGIYSSEEIKGVSKVYLTRYFEPHGDGYRVREILRRAVAFERGNLLTDEYPNDLDLAVCRNVLIYFTDQGKQRVLRGLADSLRRGGVLFTGATEPVFNPASYGLSQMHPFFYQRS